ncbi:hypothetical protein L3X38_025790 [Prunus dulcis]|uniref:CCHC-type domain-containing protein n=1 Tax=Prunus dulcis TaxID=3755 RepID=A0AAD4W538_PRUDU|nr:hypothetical protein L3X38_025790 [Prunus dulcis]
MAGESNFVQPAIPKFDGHYDHWSMLMENFLRSKEYWGLVEAGIPAAAEGVDSTEVLKKTIEDHKLKDLKTKNYLFQAIDRSILETILKKDIAKDIWDSLKQKYQGTARVKRAQLQAFRKEFEVLHMKVGESVNDYFARTLTIANKMRIHGEQMGDVVVIEKILRSMIPKFDYVVCLIEESNDIDILSIDELQSSLLVHEQRMSRHTVEEQALQVTNEAQPGGWSGGRGSYRGTGKGRGRSGFDKSTVECYNCHGLGHFQRECPKKEKQAHFAETSEEMLLMTYVDDNKAKSDCLWLLDSGCSNHMCGKKDFFCDLNEGFKDSVKLGNDASLKVQGKGSIQMEIDGTMHMVTEVFFVQDLKNNLLSIRQLQEKGLVVLMQHGTCKIVHPNRGLIMGTTMSHNRMFIIIARCQSKEQRCLVSLITDQSQLWHCRYGHLSWNGLKVLQQKKMVEAMPQVKAPLKVCEDCLVGKQQRDSIPKESTWRASGILQLVHADICGPINPTSNSKKRSPTLAVRSKTPEEAWSGVKPSVGHFRIFGCISHVHVPDQRRIKLDNKSLKCIFFGVSDESKAYRLFNPISKKIIVSRDVVFEEDQSWDWEVCYKEAIVADLECETDEGEGTKVGDNEEELEAGSTEENEDSEETDHGVAQENSSHEEIDENSPHDARTRRLPALMKDYESGQGLSEEEESNIAYLALSTDSDPIFFEDAVKNEKWRQAMNFEIETIERNDTWELTELPLGSKVIGVKWVYKMKLNENGEVDKYKARLVAKEYSQRYGVDYAEVFAPVARLDTIRVVISLAAQKGWTIYQLDVKSAFLHGELNEEVFVTQPPGYEKTGHEHKVYKLKKALYGLKQAPRAWYSRIETYFDNEGFKKCPYEHTLFIKTSGWR